MLRRSLLVVAVSMLLAAPVSAYVPSAEFVVRMLVDARREQGLKDLSLLLQTEQPAADETAEDRLYLKQPERLRYVRQAGEPLVRVDREGVQGAGDESVVRKVADAPQEYTAQLLFPMGKDNDESSARVMALLKKLGVDTTVVALARMGDRAVYIVGAKSWENDKPQLWVDKTNFMPTQLRWQRRTATGTEACETRYIEYGSGVGGNWFPRVVEHRVAGQLVRRSEVTDAKNNQDLPETLFDVL